MSSATISVIKILCFQKKILLSDKLLPWWEVHSQLAAFETQSFSILRNTEEKVSVAQLTT
jgi:hypothetical protein